MANPVSVKTTVWLDGQSDSISQSRAVNLIKAALENAGLSAVVVADEPIAAAYGVTAATGRKP